MCNIRLHLSGFHASGDINGRFLTTFMIKCYNNRPITSVNRIRHFHDNNTSNKERCLGQTPVKAIEGHHSIIYRVWDRSIRTLGQNLYHFYAYKKCIDISEVSMYTSCYGVYIRLWPWTTVHLDNTHSTYILWYTQVEHNFGYSWTHVISIKMHCSLPDRSCLHIVYSCGVHNV